MSRRRESPGPIEANGYKLGGTWDDVETPEGLKGTGNLDDDTVEQLQEEFGVLEDVSAPILRERQRLFAREIYSIMEQTEPLPSMGEHIRSWCPDFIKYVIAPFWPIFSADSSLIDESIASAMIVLLMRRAIAEPTKPTIYAMGTDTADRTIARPLDSLGFDTKLAPPGGCGSRIPYRLTGSDAPGNFGKLARLAQLDLAAYFDLYDPGRSPGTMIAYWVSDDHIYPAVDCEKIDPRESPQRRIEGQQTFYSPYSSSSKLISTLEAYMAGRRGYVEPLWADPSKYVAPPRSHILHRLTVDSLFDAMTSVLTINLGDQNPTSKLLGQFKDPDYQAIVIAAHGAGNAPFTVKRACERALDEGKLIYVASRCMISEVNESYGASLLSINRGRMWNDPYMISSGRLSAATARCLAIRSILERSNPHNSQLLVEKYARARSL